MCAFTEETNKKINDIHKAIYGNGTPKGSIVDRLARAESSIKTQWCLFLLITGLLTKLAFF